MANVFGKLWDVVSFFVRPSQPKPRVKFSPSTLHRELLRSINIAPSRNPFFNFLAEVRLQALRNNSDDRLTLTPRECVRTAKAAGRLWRSMSEEEKRPYRAIAKKQPKLKRLHINKPLKSTPKKKSKYFKLISNKNKKGRSSETFVTYVNEVESKQTPNKRVEHSIQNIVNNKKCTKR